MNYDKMKIQEVTNKKEATERRGTGASRRPGGGRFGASLSNVRAFDSLKNSAYRFYFLGMLGQWGSMNIQMVTRSLLIYRLTGSAAIVERITRLRLAPG